MKIANHIILLSSIILSTVYAITFNYNSTYPFDISKRSESDQSMYYYYEQLHSYEKKIYDELREQIEIGLQNGHPLYDFVVYNIELHSESDASVAGFRATSAFVMDNPKYFWIGRGNQQSITTLGNHIKELSISFKRSYPEENIISMLNQVNNNIADILTEVSALPSTCEQLQRIHDYLIKKVVYQYGEEYSRYNLYGALVDNASVCEGYAEAFTYICQQLGILSIIVNSETHEWNLVKMDNGQWYAMDITYDDPKINNMEFVSGDDNNKKYDYFLIGKNSKITNDSKKMVYKDSEEHQILDYLLVESSTGFEFPEVADEAYDCPIKKRTNYINDFYVPNLRLYIYILIGIMTLFVVCIILMCIKSRVNKHKRRRLERSSLYDNAF